MARHPYRHRKPRRRQFHPMRFFLLLFCLLLILYPFWEASRLTVDYRNIQVTGLPANLRNLKIAFFSDVHQGKFFSQDRVNQFINRVNSLGADIVIMGGDYAEDSESAIAFFQNANRLQARLGVFTLLGDHDRSEPDSNFGLLLAEIRNVGYLPLTNQVARVKVGQTYLSIAGVDDLENGFPNVKDVASQVLRDDFVIFAAHNPDLLADAFAARSGDGSPQWFDLALFGHTHGGQATLFGRPLFPGRTPEIGLRYLSGWLAENRANILISNGVGVSQLPLRLFAQPQIHLITLK